MLMLRCAFPVIDFSEGTCGTVSVVGRFGVRPCGSVFVVGRLDVRPTPTGRGRRRVWEARDGRLMRARIGQGDLLVETCRGVSPRLDGRWRGGRLRPRRRLASQLSLSNSIDVMAFFWTRQALKFRGPFFDTYLQLYLSRLSISPLYL